MCKQICNQCHAEKIESDFMTANKQYKTCATCRSKHSRMKDENRVKQKEMTQKWKAENKIYVQKMNEFYRTTLNYSPQDRSLLKDMIKFDEHHLHYSKDNVVGKDCSVPSCGWRPLSFFYSNDFTPDHLTTTCIRCFHIRSRIRSLIMFDVKNQLKNYLRNDKCVSTIVNPYLGCNIPDFKKHIESLFEEGMSWDKLGFYRENNEKILGIHIDHIFPIYCFDLTDPRDLYLCFHYKNCQPLWGTENLKKKHVYDEKKKNEYIEMMNDEFDDKIFIELIESVQRWVDSRIDKFIRPSHLAVDEIAKKRHTLYQDYIHDQCLEAVQLMFFAYENRVHEKPYKASLMALMKNKASRKSGSDNPRSKRVCKLSMDGDILDIYESMNGAAKLNGTFHASISKCCSNPTKLLYSGGFRWCFEDDLISVAQRCRFVRLMAQLIASRPRYNIYCTLPLPARSDETRKKIQSSMKELFSTEEGREKKKQALVKRAETMKKRREQLVIIEKECRACKQRLPASSFCKKSAAADGLQAYCKPCTMKRKKS